MLNNIQIGETRKPASERSTVFCPEGDWTYAHHPHMVFFAGRFYAAWSNGRKHEDAPGQRILLAESADAAQWTAIRPIVTPEALGDPCKVLTAAGFHVFENTLYLFYGSYSYIPGSSQDGHTRPLTDGHHRDVDLGCISTTDGVNWTGPKSLGIGIVPNHGPQKTASGRLIISGNTMFPYTDQPNGVEGYTLTGIYGDAFGTQRPVDDSETIQKVTKCNGWNANLICEGSFFQTDDGVLHMMLRSNSGRLWCSESGNDGETWTAPYPTEYTNDHSKFHFGRLPDGRFYGVSNGTPGSGRNPLDLYLSEDGENFSRHYILRDEPCRIRFPGLYKGGTYGYPHTLIHDGAMYIIYSKGKEEIEVTGIDLDQL